MNKFDVINWKKERAAKYKAERLESIKEDGRIGTFTTNEFNQSMKLSQKTGKSGVTRRTHARGNHWNHNNLPNVKADIAIWYK